MKKVVTEELLSERLYQLNRLLSVRLMVEYKHYSFTFDEIVYLNTIIAEAIKSLRECER